MGNPISQELFLERAHSRFGDKYDYSAIVYKSYKSPVKIKCRVHPVKEISITPEKHLQTTGGCKFCLREMRITMLERELQRPAIESPFIQPDLIQSSIIQSSIIQPTAIPSSVIESETPAIPRLY